MVITNKTKKIIGGSFMTVAWAAFTIFAITGTVPPLWAALLDAGIFVLGGLFGIVLIKPEIQV